MPSTASRYRIISRFFVPLGLVALLFSCGSPEAEVPPVPAAEPAPARSGRVDEMATKVPAFSAPSIDGTTFESSSFEGKVTVINFWATWCAPCVVEIPEFVALYDEWSDRPFEIVGVASDWEGFRVVRPFAEDFLMNYPVVSDSAGTVGEKFGGVYALPTTFVVDANGHVVRRYMGLFPFDEFRAQLDSLIDEAAAL
jgi:peroxiredoxin